MSSRTPPHLVHTSSPVPPLFTVYGDLTVGDLRTFPQQVPFSLVCFRMSCSFLLECPSIPCPAGEHLLPFQSSFRFPWLPRRMLPHFCQVTGLTHRFSNPAMHQKHAESLLKCRPPCPKTGFLNPGLQGKDLESVLLTRQIGCCIA